MALIAGIYVAAALSDVLDGLIARRLGSQGYFGTVIDLVSDKSLTIVSVLYAAVRGEPLVPLALIAVREIVVLGLRLVIVDESQLLPTSRIFGGVLAAVIWGNTLALVLDSRGAYMKATAAVYWIAAALFSINLAGRVSMSRRRIIAAANERPSVANRTTPNQ
jgi:phosphatidylglycerophosphate synthase